MSFHDFCSFWTIHTRVKKSLLSPVVNFRYESIQRVWPILTFWTPSVKEVSALLSVCDLCTLCWTFSLQRPSEPHEGSANSQLCRGTARPATCKLASFLQLTFPIMPTQAASVFTAWEEEATGERSGERERGDDVVQEYSGALSSAGSFHSLSQLFPFGCCSYLLAEVSRFSSNTQQKIKDSSSY